MKQRTAKIGRKTSETDVQVSLNLDGSGIGSVHTGIAFFDHMLMLFAKHGLFDLDVICRGDLEVDAHHSVEDIGICIGSALEQALGDKSGIVRFGHAYYPMDDTLVRATVDLSGRPYLVYDVAHQKERVGELDAELVEEFCKALVTHARLNLHITMLYGRNGHHIFEALFKATARALCTASRFEPRVQGIPSTKGVL
jgi:imidazoleglycerol-phosphate dehydratase